MLYNFKTKKIEINLNSKNSYRILKNYKNMVLKLRKTKKISIKKKYKFMELNLKTKFIGIYYWIHNSFKLVFDDYITIILGLKKKSFSKKYLKIYFKNWFNLLNKNINLLLMFKFIINYNDLSSYFLNIDDKRYFYKLYKNNIINVNFGVILITKYKLFFKKLIIMIKQSITPVHNTFKLNFTKSNLFISLITGVVNNLNKKNLLFTLSLGRFMNLFPIDKRWKKKNKNYLLMLSKFIFHYLMYFKFKISFFIIKNLKSYYNFIIREFKLYINFNYLMILDNSYFSKIKLKKKTYLKRRLSKRLVASNPLKY